MSVKHVIIEGLPATGKSEVSNFLKIYFPKNFRYLPELTTEIVRKHKINILKDRNKLTDVLEDEIKIRENEIQNLKKELKLNNIENGIILEESHMGIHWAYSKHLNDKYFLEKYEKKIKQAMVFPDFYIRLMIPFELSFERQIARNTPDVEVSVDIIRQMYDYLVEWHSKNHNKKINVVDANRSPELILKNILDLLELIY